MTKKMTLQERFAAHSRYTENGCRCWTGDNVQGYGRIQIAGKNYLVHRVAYAEEHGPIPDGVDILHSCDNPPCFELSHLFPGTHTENMQDKIKKKRNVPIGAHPGEKHHFAILSDDQVQRIRRLADLGFNSVQLAEQFPVSARHIRKIIKGTTR